MVFIAEKSFKSVRKTVVSTTFWRVIPAAASTASSSEILACLGFDGVTSQDARFRHQSDLPGGVEALPFSTAWD